jgi:hypothetical protein
MVDHMVHSLDLIPTSQKQVFVVVCGVGDEYVVGVDDGTGGGSVLLCYRIFFFLSELVFVGRIFTQEPFFRASCLPKELVSSHEKDTRCW